MKTRTKAAVIVAAVVVLAPTAFITKRTLFPKRYDVVSIATLPDYQAPPVLASAWKLPAAAPLFGNLAYQTNGSTCGPTSLADVERSFGVPGVTTPQILEGTGLCWTGFCIPGITLDQLGDLARARTKHRVTVLRDLSLADFRGHLARSNDAGRRYVVNFNRGLLFGVGHGHHSPIGGYLADRDLVFVLDVNASFTPWLVPTERLFAAMDSIDESTGKKRGMVLLE